MNVSLHGDLCTYMVFVIPHRIILAVGNVSEKKFVEKIKAHVLRSVTFIFFQNLRLL